MSETTGVVPAFQFPIERFLGQPKGIDQKIAPVDKIGFRVVFSGFWFHSFYFFLGLGCIWRKWSIMALARSTAARSLSSSGSFQGWTICQEIFRLSGSSEKAPGSNNV